MTGPRTETELLEIIRKQADQIEQLIAETARLQRHIKELERQQRKYVAPHSWETRKAAPKLPRRRAGEGLFTCVACGYVGELLLKQHDRAWISDLRPQAVQITAYHIPVMTCTACGRTVRGQHPNLRADQVGATAHRCEPRLAATVQTLHQELGIPQRRIPRVLHLTPGIQLTQGAIT